ncbi:MAG: anion permease [Candidatus Thermoplasmatota archaeon]|nr:anion permease [Candidatus Thermoplasmatota archaeon]MDP7264154.1 anion permease [Candidatus Thermoplasmatota archaeon]
MIILIILGLIAVIGLSYWNGANDVSKTIATIVGGRVGNYKRAVILGATFNAVGTFLALFFAQTIFKVFTEGLIKETNVGELFAASVILGAAAWIVIATKTGMPVSTTHSILGAIIFLGLFVFTTAGILWKSIALKIALPLIISPIVSFVMAYGIFWLYSKNLLCLNNLNVKISKNMRKVLNIDNAHWISCAASSFARGMNDGPKFVALAATFLVANQLTNNVPGLNTILFSVVAIAMGLGGYIRGMKVTKTLAYRVTKIGHRDGFIANLITSVLVTSGASLGMPMSTTHVSSFAIIGIGTKKSAKKVNWKTVKHMALAWFVTLPLSGLFSIISYNVLLVVGL